MDIKVICRIFYTNTKEYTFYSEAHGNFFNIDLILGYQTHFTKSNILKELCVSDNDAIKLKIDRKQISSKYINLWGSNKSSLNDELRGQRRY